MTIELFKENQKGKCYTTDDFKIYYRNKDTVSGDNSENVEEVIYLITGKAEVTLKDSTRTVESPAEINIPAKTYHKIKALTDIAFLIF
ncbi:hypothetical protein HQ571_02560 [Candidatus Kuenenbacteria bacterium]|nr:hypothetical protein [Candidatus Kuenenbacteria bacterium]